MALQHLRSSTANKRPTPGAMSDGQLAINTAAASPGLFFKDSGGSLVKVGPVHVGTTAPNASPASGGEAGNTVGEQWLDTSSSTYVFKIWDGSAWRSETGEFVNASGDTMTGALVMDNQQQVRFRETTANGTNYIALQAPASVASDKTITLPDQTGTVLVSGGATIVDADISASAEIAVSKLVDGSARQLLQTDAAGTGVEWASNIDVPGTLDVTSTATFDSIISASAGAAATPSITFTGDTNTGIYSPGADQLALATGGSGRLFVDASGNVGVGATPGRTFQVTNATNAIISAKNGTVEGVLNATTSNVNIGSASNDYLVISTNGTERIRVTSGGLVGIGTSSVNGSHRLEVNGTISANGDTSVSGTGLCFGNNSTGGYKWIQSFNSQPLCLNPLGNNVGIGTTTVGSRFVVSDGGAAGFEVDPVGFSSAPRLFSYNRSTSQFTQLTLDGATNVFAISGTEKARIDSSGRLLVGTFSTSTSSRAVFQGNSFAGSQPGIIYLQRDTSSTGLTAGNAMGYIIFADNAGSNYAVIGCEADGATGTNDYPGRLVFSTTADGASSPTERMRITQDGDVFINHNSSTSPVVGGEKLGVAGGSNIAIAASASLNTTPTVYVVNTSDTTNTYLMRFSAGSGGNTRGEIYYNGSQLVYATSSDYRLKTDVHPLVNGADLVKRLRPVEYKWLENNNQDIGFIAHEVQEVFPNAVGGEKDAVDEDGKIRPQTYDPSKLVPLLTAALQEALAEIESLKARVTALEP